MKLKQQTAEILQECIARIPALQTCAQEIEKCFRMIAHTYAQGNKLLIAGNGGSCADAEHIAGELMKGFVKRRPVDEAFRRKLLQADVRLGGRLAEKLQGALPAVSLSGHAALSTAYMNDADPVLVFAQQVCGYGRAGDTLLAVTTSGNSGNLLYAAVAAKAKGLHVAALTGRDGGRIKEFADVSVIVNEQETYKIQELHLPIYHTLCRMLEEEFFEI